MDRYSARMNLRGSTQRERELNRLKSDIVRKAPSSLSYKDVKLNGEPTQLMINTSTKPYYKEFQSLPDQRILAGDYVEWADSMWLVLNADCDDEVYTDGNLRQCQHRIYWQKADGTIVSRFAYTENASAYNNGETGNNTITLESNQFMVYIPYDKETAELDNGKRIHMSRSNAKCKPYELTRPDDVTYGFGEKGVLNIIFTQTQYNQDKDKLITLEDGTQAWICGYIDSTPTPPQPSTPDETADLWHMELEYSTLKIKPLDKDYTIIAHLYDGNNAEITDSIEYEWTVESNIDLYLTHKANSNVLTISLSSDCEGYGEKVTISCMSKYTGQSDEIQMEVTEVW